MLSTKKKQNIKVGKLKFKSDFNSINLKQYENTHKILDSKHIRIQGIKNLKVFGLNQFIEIPNIEYANAKLIKKPSGYYVKFTTFVPKVKLKKQDGVVGVDFGCSTSFTLSTGEKLDIFVGESDRLKRIQRRIQKSKKGSNNRRKLIFLLQKEYEKLTNKKQDLANKIVSKLTQYEQVVMQDEQISLWKVRNGRKIQHSVLSRVKEKLLQHNNVFCLNRFVPTTKLCSSCGKLNELKLSNRTYKCECGASEDRDIHAAKNMVWLFENFSTKIGMGRTEFKRAEFIECLNQTFSGH